MNSISVSWFHQWCFLGLLFVAGESIAAEVKSSSILVQSKSSSMNEDELFAIHCSELVDNRFRLCKSSQVSGIIDFDPQEHGLEFLPLFFINGTLALEVQISLSNNSASLVSFFPHNFIGLDKRYYEEVFQVYHLNDYEYELSDPIEEERMQIAQSIIKFIGSLRLHERVNKVASLAFEQRLTFKESGDVISYFSLIPEAKKTINIITKGSETLDEQQSIFYMSLVEKKGGVIAYKKAEKLYKKIAAMKNVSFKYTDNGCYARAHIVAEYLHTKGVKVGKICLKGELENPLTKNSFIYHVAATLEVEEEGVPTIYVVDPSFCRTLSSVENWVSLFNKVHKPIIISYPLPTYSQLFSPLLMAQSSHLCLHPCGINMNVSFNESLLHANDVNAKYASIIKRDE